MLSIAGSGSNNNSINEKQNEQIKNIQNNKDKQQQLKTATTINQLSDDSITKYLKNFLTVADYRSCQQGKQLLKLLIRQPNEQKLQKSLKLIFYFHQNAKPQGKVCVLQFVKQLMDTKRRPIISIIQKNIINILLDIIQYRYHVKNMLRGSTYFMNQGIDKADKESNIAELIRLANTYFRMGHQMLYVWGVKYFPKSHFGIVYRKLSKSSTFPQYPTDFKFYRSTKVEQFAKSQEIKAIDQFFMQRKNNIVPALSGRSNKSGKTVRSKNKQKPDIKQKTIQSNKPITQPNKNVVEIKSAQQKKQQIQIQQQQDVFSPVTVSKIIQRGSKIVSKPVPISQKIPKNFIYRQSSIQDPEDITNLPIKTQTQNHPQSYKSQIKTKKGTSIQIPMGIISEVMKQDGTSNLKSNNTISINSKKTQIKSIQSSSKTQVKQKQKQKQITGNKKQHKTNRQQKIIESSQNNSINKKNNTQIIKQYQDKQTIKNQIIINDKNINKRKNNQITKLQQVLDNKYQNSKQYTENQIDQKRNRNLKEEKSKIKFEGKEDRQINKQQNKSNQHSNQKQKSKQKQKQEQKQRYKLKQKQKQIGQQIDDEKVRFVHDYVSSQNSQNSPHQLEAESDIETLHMEHKSKPYQYKIKQPTQPTIELIKPKQKNTHNLLTVNDKNNKPINLNKNQKNTINTLNAEQNDKKIKFSPKSSQIEQPLYRRQKILPNFIKQPEYVIQSLNYSPDQYKQMQGKQKIQISELPISSQAQSLQIWQANNISKSKFSNRSHSLKNRIKKKKLFSNQDDDQRQLASIKGNFNVNYKLNTKRINQQQNLYQKNKISFKRLSVNHVYEIKQIFQSTKLSPKTPSTQQNQNLGKQHQTQRKLRSQRKFKKFREVALSYVPQNISKIKQLQNEVMQAQTIQITNIKSQILEKINQLQQKSQNKNNQHLSQIQNLLAQYTNKILKPHKTNSDMNAELSNNKMSRISSKIGYTTDNFGNTQTKIRTKSNSTKRSSFSEIRNKNEFQYQQGTMLFLMAKRKSVLI